MKNIKEPLVSIGMPVYNGERYIRQALDSLLSQDYPNFELIISDNASKDTTQQICLEYKDRDKRIKYYRNKQNIMEKNFHRVLTLSKGQYFMWAAHDDLWAPNYISSLSSALEANKNAVLAFSKLYNISEENKISREYPMLSLLSLKTPSVESLNDFICFKEENGKANLIYGLIRSNYLKNIKLFKPYGFGDWGTDYLTVFNIALYGNLQFVTDTAFYKRLTEENLSRWANTPPDEYCHLIQGYFQGYRNIIKKSGLQDIEKDILLMSISTRETEWYSRILCSNTINNTAFKIKSMLINISNDTTPENIEYNQSQFSTGFGKEDCKPQKDALIEKTILFLTVGCINYDCNINFYEPLKAIFKNVVNYNYIEKLGHIGKEAMNDEIIHIVKSKKPDYVFIHTYQDQIELSTLDKINMLGSKTVAWFSDDHWRFDSYSKFIAQHVFCSITTDTYTVKKYKELYLNVIKSQWASNQNYYRQITTPFIHDVSFVGQDYGKRGENLAYLKNKGIPLSIFGKGFGKFLEFDDIIKLFNSSRINLNFSGSSADDRIKQIKGRVFEVPMCGGFLLTEYADEIEKYFDIDKEIVCFEDCREAEEKIHYYLKNEDRRLEIAKNGYVRVLKDHTWEKRLEDIFNDLESIEERSDAPWIIGRKQIDEIDTFKSSADCKTAIPPRKNYEIGFHGDSYLLNTVDLVLAKSDAFIETGAYMGDTLEYVARNFGHLNIFSCEPKLEHFTAARNKLCSFLKNITLEQTISPDFLYKIINTQPDIANKTVVFWLDAHSFGFEWPLKDEIKFITENFRKAYIFIDDFKIPGRPDFQYDSYANQECSWEFISDELCSDKGYSIYLPKYREKTSRHYPLVGWVLIEFGHRETYLPNSLLGYVTKTSWNELTDENKSRQNQAANIKIPFPRKNNNSDCRTKQNSTKAVYICNRKHAKNNNGKHVLLVTSAAPNQSPFSTTEKRPPIGLGFLISVLRDAGHEVFFIDNYLQPSNFLETDYLSRNNIDYIGIYANTICYRDTLRMLHRLEWLRQTGRWQGKIIVGGPHATVCLDTIPDVVDYVVQGEGEHAILDIVEGRVTERVVRCPRIKDLDELPMPAWDYFVNLPYDWGGEWFPEKPVFTMNTSRGCPFRCTFCSVGSIWGKEYTCFSAERIVSDIEYLIEHYGAKGVYFREDNFTLNKKRLTRFCNLLLEKGIKIHWACETRVNTLDREIVELMARAGVCGFYFGVESGSQRVLDFLQKDITVEQTRNAFKLCHEFGIKMAASVVVGVPTETEAELKQTITLLKEIKPTVTWFNVFVGIPNSQLYQYAIENKLYEFIDDRGLVYLKGHNERVKKFYGKGWDADIPVSLHQNELVNPDISVVMSVYNGEKYLKEAIQSVLRQTYQDFEFIIVDDGSTDKTNEVLKNFDDLRIKVIKNSENQGLTKSLNRGIKAAKGKYIARMDADDISIPHRFETQIEFLEKNPDYALVGSSYYHIDENGKTISIIRVLTNDLDIRNGLKRQNWFGHGSVMMRKDAFLDVGGYDEQYKLAQDYDLWFRMAEVYQLANTEEPLYCWRLTPSCISKEKEAEQRYYANLAISEATKRQTAKTAKEKMSVSLTDPVVSVIVPTHNRPDMLTDTLKSILDQTYQNFEIIVVNDAGVDVENIVTSLNHKGNIIYVKHSRNRGLAAARNTGIKVARGKYIAYLDDDDTFYPDHLETLVKFLETNGYKIAYTDACRAHQEKENGKYVIKKKDMPYSFDFDYDRILVGNFVPVLCFMHEKSCLDEVGYLDEVLTTHEDWDLWIRMSRKFKFAHIKKPTAEFSWRTDGTTMTSSKRVDFLRTLEIIYQKYEEYAKNKPYIIEAQKISLQNLKNEIYGSSDPMNVSIIIPLFNQVKYTKQCLEALVQNTPDDLYEVIIVDNASTDGTKEFMKCLGGDVKIIINEENLGFAKACNQGARAASGKYLVFLNNDTVPQPGWLEEMVKVADGNEDIAIVGSKLLFPDGTIEHAGVAIADSKLGYHLYRGYRDFLPANKPRDFQVVTGACMLVKKDIFWEVNGFDERYINGCEDIDLCFKVKEFGKRIFYNPRSVLIHFEGKSEGRQDKMNDNIKFLLERWGHKVQPDDKKFLMDDGFRFEAMLDGEKKWVYHEELCKKTVSIIIVTYNSLEDIQQCINSIESQTILPYELIVIDNNSTDGTQDYLKGLKDAHGILNKENMGFSGACNQGIKIAKGDYIVLLNPDTVVTKMWDVRLIAHFKKEIGAVGPVSNYVAGLQKFEFYKKESLIGEIQLNALSEKLYQWNRGQGVETKLLIGFCLMIKRDVIDKIGMLDEDLFLGSDDLEYSWRLRNKGYKLMVATDTFIYHKGQASFKTEPEQKMTQFTQESQDVLYSKLETHYGEGNVPSPMELWNIGWFKPTKAQVQSKISGTPLISIIILTHNQLEYTKKCIGSIFKYTKEPFELIVVDNGSTDGTVEYLESETERRRTENGGRKKKGKGKKKVSRKPEVRIKIIKNKENLGFAAGNNQGMAEARGNYVVLMNNDLVVTSGWLTRMMACAERNPQIGIVGPMSNYVSGPQLIKEVNYDTISLARLNKFSNAFSKKHAGQAMPFWRVVGFCMLIKRAVIDKIGGLDGCFGLGNFEDDDFSLRAALAGFESWIAQDCFVHHFGSRTFVGAKIDYRESLHKNWEIFKQKWGIPADVAYGASYDMALVVKNGFILTKHYCPLTPEEYSVADGETLFTMGKCAEAQKDYLKAAEWFERALKLKPDDISLLNSLGNCFIQLENLSKAREVYKKSLGLNGGQENIKVILWELERIMGEIK